MRFGETVEAGMTPAELTQWEQNALSATVPAVCVSGTKLFANYLGYLFAIDLKSGKLLWRSAAFHNVEVPAMQNVAQFTDTSRYTIIASGEHVWTLSRDLKDGNFQAAFVLTCLRAENGEVIWQSKDLSDYAQLDLNGPPILEAGKIFIPASGPGNPQQGQGGMQQLVLAIQPHDGKVIWKSEVGRTAARQSLPVVGLRRQQSRGPAAAGLPRRGDLRGNPSGRLRAARRRFRSTGLGLRLPDRRGSRPEAGCSVLGRRHAGDGTDARVERAAFERRGVSAQGAAIDSTQCRRPQPDESSLGTTDLQGLAPAGGRRSHRLPWGRRALRDRHREPQAALGDACSRRLRERAGCWCEKRRSGSRRRAGSSSSTPSRAKYGGSSAARTWARSEET